MPTFDAGSISGKATLDRDEFTAGLDEISAKADEFSRKTISPKVDLTGIAKMKTQLDQLSQSLDKVGTKKVNPNVNMNVTKSLQSIDAVMRKLDKLGDRTVKPDIDLSGLAKSDADLALLQAQLDKLNDEKVSPKVDVNTQDAEHGMKRLLDSALALAPALAPIGAAAIGGAVGLAGAFTAAGVGVGAFALAAAPALKKVASAEDALNTTTQSRTAAQKQALDGLSTSEENAAKQMLSLVQTYHGFTDALEPTTFTVLAKGADIAKDGLHDIAPIAHTTGAALIGLEGDLKKALDTQYMKTFFDYLGVEAPKAVGSLGRSVGNVGLGFSGILQAFTPVEHELENGLEGLSQKFAAFGKGAGTNSGLQSFIDYVQIQGPKVIHLIGQFGSTFAQVAKDAAPLGAAEVKIVSGILSFVDAEAKAHPKLIEFALGIYTINKAVAALKLGGLATGLSSVVGSAGGAAGGGKGLLGFAAGMVGLAAGSKTVGEVFPKTTSAALKGGEALTSVGEAVGGGLAAGAGLVGGLGLLVGGLVAVQAEFSKGKQDVDQYAASIAKAAGVAPPSGTDNSKNLAAYNDAIYAEGNAKYQATQTRNSALLTAGGASDVTGAAFAEQAAKVQALAAAQKQLTQQQKATIAGDTSMQTSLAKLGPGYKLTGDQAATLADKLGINLAAGFKTTADMSDKQKTAVADNVSKLKEYEAEIKQSHDPTAAFAADVKQAGDATQTAAQQQTAFNNALSDYQSLTTGVATSSAQAGDALATLSKDFSKGTTAAGKNAAAQKILSGNLLEAGPQTRKVAEDLSSLQSSYDGNYEAMFKTASETGHTAQGFAEVTKQAGLNRSALIKTAEQMGFSATDAKKLADKYAAIPKSIITTAHLNNVKAVESDAANMKQKILDIPLTHTSTAKADITKAEQNIADLKAKIKGIPKSAQTTASVAIKKAETDLANLEQHIWDLTHKKWSVTINADGSVDVPNIRNGGGPVQAPAYATGGYTGNGGKYEPAGVVHRGEFVINKEQTAKHMPLLHAINSGMPGYAAGGLIDITAKTNAASLIPGVDAVTSALQAAQKYAQSLHVNYTPGAGVAQWASLILKALAANGQPSSLLGTVERRMNQESGGNPNAINLSDINAQNGDPSRGLMQTIGSTFSAFHAPGTSMNIYDPYANLMASMRYALARYGSLSAAYNRAGGYANGGHPRAGEIARVGERGPELVQFGTSATVYPNGKSPSGNSSMADLAPVIAAAVAEGLANSRWAIDRNGWRIITQQVTQTKMRIPA